MYNFIPWVREPLFSAAPTSTRACVSQAQGEDSHLLAEVAQNLPSVTGNYIPGCRKRKTGILPPPGCGTLPGTWHRVSHGFLAVSPEPADSVTEIGGVGSKGTGLDSNTVGFEETCRSDENTLKLDCDE